MALRNRPKFSVTAPAALAASNVGVDGPFSVTNRLLKSIPPISSPITGVKMSFTRLDTIEVNAAPMMMPTARSTTLPRMMKALNSAHPTGRMDGCDRKISCAMASSIDVATSIADFGSRSGKPC